MAKAKSLVSYIRQQLKVPGRTEHSGRGFWLCYVNLTWAEFSVQVRTMATKLHAQGIVTDVQDTGDAIIIRIKVKSDFAQAGVFQHSTTKVSFDRFGIENYGVYTMGSSGYYIDA